MRVIVVLLLLNKCSFLINDNKVNKEKGIFKLNINIKGSAN